MFPQYHRPNISTVGVLNCSRIPTSEVCNDECVNLKFEVNLQTSKMTCHVMGTYIDVAAYGFCDTPVVDQILVDSLIRVSLCVKLCHGLEGDYPEDSKVPVVKTWCQVQLHQEDMLTRMHSHNCEILLQFNTPTSTSACVKCKQFLKMTALNKAKRNIDSEKFQQKSDTCENRDASISSEDECKCKCRKKDEVNKEDKFNPYIFLKQEYHEDLIKVIEMLTPNAPQFKHLFRAQLLNARNIDPRQRKWDPVLISIALNLWAR